MVAARGLAVVSDEGALTAAIDEAIAANPDVAARIRDGKDAAAGVLVGAVMNATRGKADAARVRELILARLSSPSVRPDEAGIPPSVPAVDRAGRPVVTSMPGRLATALVVVLPRFLVVSAPARVHPQRWSMGAAQATTMEHRRGDAFAAPRGAVTGVTSVMPWS